MPDIPTSRFAIAAALGAALTASANAASAPQPATPEETLSWLGGTILLDAGGCQDAMTLPDGRTLQMHAYTKATTISGIGGSVRISPGDVSFQYDAGAAAGGLGFIIHDDGSSTPPQAAAKRPADIDLAATFLKYCRGELNYFGVGQ